MKRITPAAARPDALAPADPGAARVPGRNLYQSEPLGGSPTPRTLLSAEAIAALYAGERYDGPRAMRPARGSAAR